MRRSAMALAAGLVAFAGLALADDESDIIDLLGQGSSAAIKAAGRKAAEADISGGRLRVVIGGSGEGVYDSTWKNPVGPDWDPTFARGLPQLLLPFGCAQPLAPQAELYANAYNEVMLPYLAERGMKRRELIAWVRRREAYREWCSEWSWWHGDRRDNAIRWCSDW